MENEERTVEIRRLTKADRTKLSELIKLLVEKTDNKDLINMVPSSKDESEEDLSKNEQTANILQFAFNLLEGFIQFIEEDVTVWFMDLIGITNIEEYNKLDFDIEVQIIEQILSQPSFEGFFLRGLQAVSKIKSLVSPLQSSKTQ